MPKTTGDQVGSRSKHYQEHFQSQHCRRTTGRRFPGFRRSCRSTACLSEDLMRDGGPRPRPYDFFPEAVRKVPTVQYLSRGFIYKCRFVYAPDETQLQCNSTTSSLAPSTCPLVRSPTVSSGKSEITMAVPGPRAGPPRDRSPTRVAEVPAPRGGRGVKEAPRDSLALQTQDALKDDPTHAQQQEYKAEHAREDRQGGQQRGFFPQ